jgi:hypothetical protein
MELGEERVEEAVGFDVDAIETERLGAEITTLAANIAAATCRMLLMIGEFDRREAWARWDCVSCAHWLAWQAALDGRTARDHVRVARALRELPLITEAFSAGRLSYSQVRALTRIARPESEQDLLEMANYASAAQLEKIVRGYQSAEALLDQSRDSYDHRELTWWHTGDGSLVIQARLPAEDGAVVVEALRRRADKLREADGASDTAGGSAEPRPAPRTLLADALTDLARTRGNDLDESADASDDVQVVVNVDLETLASDAPGTCRLAACGTVLAPETARRLACDQPIIGRDGKRTRFASRRLNRLLDQRDRGCRFPGCTHTRHLHSHHITHWARGGATKPDNLIRLCSHHHRCVHEGGYRITGHPDGELTFRRRDGRVLRTRPPSRTGHAKALTADNRRRGIDPAPGDITPDCGDKLDLHWVVRGMLDDAYPPDRCATTLTVVPPGSRSMNRRTPHSSSRIG